MKNAFVATGILIALSQISACAQDLSDKWLGSWTCKAKAGDVIQGISIIRDNKDIKLKFAKGPNKDYMGEGIAEWYEQPGGKGVYVTDFMENGARMHVIVMPSTHHQLRTNVYTKYDDGRPNQCFSETFSRDHK